MKGAPALSCVLALACSSPGAEPVTWSGGGAASGPAAVAGAPAASGTTGNPTSASAGSASSGFTAAGASGTEPTAGSAGQHMVAGGSGGMDSRPGSSGASGMTGSDLLGVAAVVDGFRWEFPCAGSAFVSDAACSYDLTSWKNAGGNVDQSNGVKAELTRTFGGSADALYDVTLRFRGVAEGNMYKHDDGMLDAAMTSGPHFHVGGTVHEHFQVYSLAVSEPAQIFYLNAFHDLVTPLPVDYTATIRVRGGATITFGMADTNTACFANSARLVIAELAPAPEPFNGQFIQADVVSVTPAL